MAQQYLKEKVYNFLKEKIISCEYEPGTILNEAELVKSTGASRTPVHNAVIALASENLLTVIPKKGILVNGVTQTDIIEVLDIRSILEPAIILRYGDRIEKEYLQDFLKRCKNVSDVQMKRDLDVELHRIIYSICTNQHLKDILNSLEMKNQRNRVWRSSERRISEKMPELEAIVSAWLDGDLKEASRAMETHLNNARSYAMQKYF